MRSALGSLLGFALACLVARPVAEAVAAGGALLAAACLAAQTLLARALALLRDAAEASKAARPWSKRCPSGTRSSTP